MLQIVTDSSTLYTVDEARELGFEALPLCVNIGDMEGRDLLVDMEEFYARIGRGEIPKSSQPPIGDVVETYEKYKEDEIIDIAMADGLSGTYQTACSAAQMVENKENITVVNTKTLCGPHRYMVEKAQQMKLMGKTKQEILDWLEYIKKKTESFLIPQDFAFLKRGGRLAPMTANIGAVLKLKPIMTLTEDGRQLKIFGIKRTMKSAVSTIIDHWKDLCLDARHILYVVHANVPEEAKQIAERIKEAFPLTEIQIHPLSPVFVTQGGPACVALQYIEK
ncbi:MAG: DegV family protein [Lachnospiraceae bacterium]|nr:DegV family protein [Lachnospiraceae bacterium]